MTTRDPVTNRKARRAAGRGSVAAADPALARAQAALMAGDAGAAAAAAEAAAAANPRAPAAPYLLGTARLMLGRPDQAEAALRRAVQLAPALAEAHNNLGLAIERQGRLGEAEACYRRAVALKPAYPEAHTNLGNVLLVGGRAEAAVPCFQRALAARPAYAEAAYNLANALAALGRSDEAVAAYGAALAARPRFPEALNNLAALLLELHRFDEAARAAAQAVAQAPDAGESQRTLGRALAALGRTAEAVACCRRAVALQPGDPDALLALANVLLSAEGGRDEAGALFRQACRLRPVSLRPGAKSPPDFSVLLLVAPGAANTPSDYLVGRSGYDSRFVAVMEGVDHDPELLRRQADVVVNLISDVDQGRHVLPRAARLADAIGRPVVNHPRAILATGRDAVARRLAPVPGLRVPKTVRVAGHVLADPAAHAAAHAEALDGFAFPVLARAGGAHGGEAFELLADAAQLARFAAERPRADHYLTQFVDTRSPDGFFRKYRLFFTDGRILPYHLAVADHWKVHHFRTRMAEHAWMRDEEEAFVAEPTRVFGAAQWQALAAVQAEIGLDHFGIDCALDAAGAVVVFEVNATMLIHGETGTFAYKAPYVARIKAAFDTMLATRRETPSAPGAPDAITVPAASR